MFPGAAYVEGWGTLSYGGESSQTLQEVSFNVWNQDECSKAYPTRIVSTQMCAGVKEGGKDSCQVRPWGRDHERQLNKYRHLNMTSVA